MRDTWPPLGDWMKRSSKQKGPWRSTRYPQSLRKRLDSSYYYKRNYEEAIQALEHALTLDPGSARARFVLGRVYDAQGRTDQAIEQTSQAIDMADDAGVGWRVQIIRLHAVAGRHEEARAQLAEFTRDMERRKMRVAAEHLGYLHLALKDEEKALEYLERAVNDRDPAVLWLAVDPRVDSIKDHRRFRELVDRLGIR